VPALVSLEKDWKLSGLPWWVWLVCVVPEAALLIPLAWQRPRHRLEQLGKRRMVALALLAVVSLTNALLVDDPDRLTRSRGRERRVAGNSS
jgi:hypothetical protein